MLPKSYNLYFGAFWLAIGLYVLATNPNLAFKQFPVPIWIIMCVFAAFNVLRWSSMRKDAATEAKSRLEEDRPKPPRVLEYRPEFDFNRPDDPPAPKVAP
jgi:hypothetical protein